MRRRIKTRTSEEKAYKTALLIGGNFAELDTEVNFRTAERKKNNFHGAKVNNHCTTKPKKRKKRKNMMRKEKAERSFEYALNQIKSIENLENREKRNRSRRGR